MVAGMEAEIFRPDDELRRLARRAVELGVDTKFQQRVPAEDVIKTLQQSASPGERGSKSSRPRDTPGSTSMSGTGSITITARGTTTSRCPLRVCPSTSGG